MLLVSLYSLIILAILLGAQIWRPQFLLQLAEYSFWLSVFFIFFVSSYLTLQQYQIWLTSPLAQLLLPPHQPIGYFIQYSITRFWTGPMIAFAMALIALVAAKLLNKKFQERFFWPAEPWLFATGLLLAGHPGWMYYTAALFAVAILWQLLFVITGKSGHERVSTYYLWLPVAILTILINTWFRFPPSS